MSNGGPPIDGGHPVRLVNADPANTPLPLIAFDVLRGTPQVVLIGHSHLTSVHPTVLTIARLLEQRQTALIAWNVKVTIVGSARADDLVRDADILHLHKKGRLHPLSDGSGRHR